MFCVIVATYNARKYIIEQLTSIASQTITPDVIYIYDDGSSDDTLSLIHEWKAQQQIKVIVRKNSSNKGYTRNFLDALFEAEDDYIFFCDQDDVWNNKKIELYKYVIDANKKDIPLLITSAYSITNEVLTLIENKHENTICKNISESEFIKDCSYPGMTFCINKKLKEIAKQKFDPEKVFFQDYFISLLALNYGKMICIGVPTVLYRQHTGNQLGAGGKGKCSVNHWRRVLEQKNKEMIMVSTYSKSANIYKSKLNFSEKRIHWLENKRFTAIICNFFAYLKYYNIKSFIADLYYCMEIEKNENSIIN